jgi:hypothetical protein
MREWCNCGSGIRAVSPRRINAWRENHNHTTETDQEPERSGSHAMVEHAGRRYFESESTSKDIPIVQARTGFMPN